MNDVVHTPLWAAKDMVDHFEPRGKLLDPCRGLGVFYDLLRPRGQADWCEIAEGRDFFSYAGHVDWVVGNPPYSVTRPWFRHSYEIADNLLYLVPLRNIFSGYGFVKEIHEFGGIAEIRVYGTGSRLNFPMGNAIGALHIKRRYQGSTAFTFFDEITSRNSNLDLEAGQ